MAFSAISANYSKVYATLRNVDHARCKTQPNWNRVTTELTFDTKDVGVEVPIWMEIGTG